jgi:hypothetical protein
MFPPKHFHALYDTREQPRSPALRIDLFRHDQERHAIFWSGKPVTVAFEGREDAPAYVGTFTIGPVGFHLFGTTAPDVQLANRSGGLESVALRQIWPTVQPVPWLAVPAINHNQLVGLADVI